MVHVSQSALTNDIYAGSVSKDGKSWLSDKACVTGQACFAVARHVEQYGEPVTVDDGKSKYEITVKKL